MVTEINKIKMVAEAAERIKLEGLKSCRGLLALLRLRLVQ